MLTSSLIVIAGNPDHDPNTHHCLCGADGKSATFHLFHLLSELFFLSLFLAVLYVVLWYNCVFFLEEAVQSQKSQQHHVYSKVGK